MTTLIQQRTNHDCVLASMAMAIGKEKWEDAWTEEDLQKVVESRGIADYDPWLDRHGLKEGRDYISIYVHEDSMRVVKALLWKRRALLSVESVNHNYGSHAVYWDGERIWDPNEGVEGKQHFRFLSTVFLNRVWIFKD